MYGMVEVDLSNMIQKKNSVKVHFVFSKLLSRAQDNFMEFICVPDLNKMISIIKTSHEIRSGHRQKERVFQFPREVARLEVVKT